MNQKLERCLVYYFGIVQMLHLFTLIRALMIFKQKQILPFPALPPVSGWTTQSEFFLIGNGLIDALNIILSILFVSGYLQSKKWTDKTGLITLTILLYSAVIFAYGTVNAGAWTAHPFAYWSMALIYLPILGLTFYWYLRKN